MSSEAVIKEELQTATHTLYSRHSLDWAQIQIATYENNTIYITQNDVNKELI